jgi:hypothetical protein
MALLVLKTHDDNPIANGKLLVLVEDTGIWKAKEFDEKTESLSDVMGVSYTKVNTGRISANPDGFYYNDFDYSTPNEDLSQDYNTANANWNPSFNPAADDSYVYVATNGMVAVEKIYTALPASWKKLKSGTTYDIYVIL